MADFCCILLANGALASVLALFVWMLGTWIKRPALLHLLWVLVLLRLIAPPLLTIDVAPARDWLATMVQRGSEEQRALVRERIADHPQLLMAMGKALQSTNVIPRRTSTHSR